MNKTGWDTEALKKMKTLHQGQCCDCKIDTGHLRVWLCRVGGGITVEQYKPKIGRWEVVAGGCEELE